MADGAVGNGAAVIPVSVRIPEKKFRITDCLGQFLAEVGT